MRNYYKKAVNGVIRIDLSYNGTRFCGYQRQIGKPSVQAELEKALSVIYKEPITVYCAGRTDTGVHALHQVVSFKAPCKVSIPVSKLKIALNALLADDIQIIETRVENKSFHARFSPVSRTYLYIIDNNELCSPFKVNQVWHYPSFIHYKKLKKALSFFEGENHFGSFCEKPAGTNHVRTIYRIKVRKRKNLIYIFIEGNGFLRRMIRIIIGSAVSIAHRTEVEPSVINKIFEFQDRNKNPFMTAPPQGLYFYRVKF